MHQPLGASWKGDEDKPHAATNKPLVIIDEAMDEPTDVFPEEAEQLMGMEIGTTAGEGITNIDRLRCIGAGWDINVTSMILKHRIPDTLEAQATVYLMALSTKCSEGDLTQGAAFHKVYCDQPTAYL